MALVCLLAGCRRPEKQWSNVAPSSDTGTPVVDTSPEHATIDTTSPPAPVCAPATAPSGAALEVGSREGAFDVRLDDYVPRVRLRVWRDGRSITERELFSLPDIEPIDGCHANETESDVDFACARGDHPGAHLSLTADGPVLTITHPGTSPVTEALGPASCVGLSMSSSELAPALAGPGSVRYEQWSPAESGTRPAASPPEGGLQSLAAVTARGPFSTIASELEERSMWRRRRAVASAPERCADAGAGPARTVDVVVWQTGPRHPPGQLASRGWMLSAPSLAPQDLDFDSGPEELCEARAYPRSQIAVVRCFHGEDGVMNLDQLTLYVDHDDVRSTSGATFALPCHSRVHFVIRS